MSGITVTLPSEGGTGDVLLLLCGVEKNVNNHKCLKPLHMTACMAYISQVKLIKATSVSSDSSCSTDINTNVRRSINPQDSTEQSNRLIMENLQRHVAPGLAAITDQEPRIWSSIPFFYLTKGVKLRWSLLFKLNRDGKRALGQPATAVFNWKLTRFTPWSWRYFLLWL